MQTNMAKIQLQQYRVDNFLFQFYSSQILLNLMPILLLEKKYPVYLEGRFNFTKGTILR